MLEFIKKRQDKIDQILADSCDFEDKSYPFFDPEDKGRHFICKKCFTIMDKQKKMPPSSIKNELTVEKLPPDIEDLTNTENYLIVVNILFMKLRKVPKSQIEKMEDRTVLVPFEPADIMETINNTLLPRSVCNGQ